MKYRNLIILFICLFSSASVCAQYYNQKPEFLKANSVWAFGYNVGIDFNGPTPVTFKTKMDAVAGASSVSDQKTGALLFYSDGRSVWDKNNQVMPNGSGLFGNNGGSTMQGVSIVQVVNSKSKYYVFSLNGPSSLGPYPSPIYGFTGSLFYSVVDMELNNGLGDVVSAQKNINLGHDSLSGGMIAIPGCNNDIWLMVHTTGYPIFKAYHITELGVNPTPVVSVAGAQIQVNYSTLLDAYYNSSMTVSPDRRRIVISGRSIFTLRLDLTGVLLCDFNSSTGEVSNSILVDGHQRAFGQAFSPDNSKLYFAIPSNPNNWASPHNVVQYDISNHDSAAIAASKIVVADSISSAGVSYFKAYGDKIYINSRITEDALHVINKPNLSGRACDFQSRAIILQDSTEGKATLPTEVVFAMEPIESTNTTFDSLLCTTDGGEFPPVTLRATPGFWKYKWDDGSTESTRNITAPGIYWVECADVCGKIIDSFIYRHVDLPDFSLGLDTFTCNGDSVKLRGPDKVDGLEFLWSDGSNGRDFTITKSGTYSLQISKDGCSLWDTIQVSIKDFRQDLGPDLVFCHDDAINIQLDANIPNGAKAKWSTGSTSRNLLVQDTGVYWVTVNDALCKMSDTVNISKVMCDCAYVVPSAFTPNGDGLNDVFKLAILDGCIVNKYSLKIYNRYGQLVYTSNQPQKGWDGFLNGKPADVGVYFFTLYFEGGVENVPHYKKGDLSLIR